MLYSPDNQEITNFLYNNVVGLQQKFDELLEITQNLDSADVITFHIRK